MSLAYDFSKCVNDPCTTKKGSPTRKSVTFALMEAAKAGILESASIKNREDAFKFMNWTMMQNLKKEAVILKWASDNENDNSIYVSYLTLVECVNLIGVVVYWS